jgi:hypothetical protein
MARPPDNDRGRPPGKETGPRHITTATNGRLIVLPSAAAVAPPVPDPAAPANESAAIWLELAEWAPRYRASWGRSA